MTAAQERILMERIDWLKQKLAQCAVGGPEYTSSRVVVERTKGSIGALEWALRELKAVSEPKE